jgi:hypothetical protein
MAKGKKLTTGKKLLYGIIGLIVIIFFIQLSSAAITTQNVAGDIRAIRDGMAQFGGDLNEMREYLLLPPQDYSYLKGKKEEDIQDADMLTQSVYQFVNQVGKEHITQKKKNENTKAIYSLKSSSSFWQNLSQLDLLPANWNFYIQSIIGIDDIAVIEEQNLEDVVLAYLGEKTELILSMQSRIKEQQDAVKLLWEDEGISSVFSEKKLQPDLNPLEIDEGFEYTVQNLDNEILSIILVDRKTGNLIFHGGEYMTAEELKIPFLEKLRSLSGETEHMSMLDDKKKELEDLLSEDAFAETLGLSHLTIKEPRPEGVRIYYDLINSDDETMLGSIIFETETGNVFFYDTKTKEEFDMNSVFEIGSKKN